MTSSLHPTRSTLLRDSRKEGGMGWLRVGMGAVLLPLGLEDRVPRVLSTFGHITKTPQTEP